MNGRKLIGSISFWASRNPVFAESRTLPGGHPPFRCEVATYAVYILLQLNDITKIELSYQVVTSSDTIPSLK